jgi:hypothetical protein
MSTARKKENMSLSELKEAKKAMNVSRDKIEALLTVEDKRIDESIRKASLLQDERVRFTKKTVSNPIALEIANAISHTSTKINALIARGERKAAESIPQDSIAQKDKDQSVINPPQKPNDGLTTTINPTILFVGLLLILSGKDNIIPLTLLIAACFLGKHYLDIQSSLATADCKNNRKQNQAINPTQTIDPLLSKENKEDSPLKSKFSASDEKKSPRSFFKSKQDHVTPPNNDAISSREKNASLLSKTQKLNALSEAYQQSAAKLRRS